MGKFNLGDLSLKTIAVRVKDRDLMIHFYRDIIGFHLLREENELAILGYKEPMTELLWLEESPRAKEHKGEIKKMQRFSLAVPNEEELANVAYRAQKNEYPVKDALKTDKEKGLLLVDPEGNEIEVFYAPDEKSSTEQANHMDVDALAAEATEKKKIHQSYFGRVHLNVSDVEKQEAFLSDILGLKVHEENGKLRILNRGDFHVGLTQASGGTIDEPTDKVLGLDFLQFIISKEDLVALVDHLNENNKEFFVDKKQSLITIYDSVGIEWWFVLK
ncbi:VOC family protein [Enterococcus sp. AZ109]|uniref:VOC family protein n=1 Tax=Enterococcus sp. AZ109 TaxID=2774634 RepID=UPI003F235AC9